MQGQEEQNIISTKDHPNSFKVKSIPFREAVSEALQLSPLLFQACLDPVEAYKAYIPSYTMFGFWGAKQFDPASDIPSLAGKVILVTGGNSGLGFETIRQLAAHRPSRIYLAARTPNKGQEAVKVIKRESPSVDVVYLPLDLTSFKSIEDAAKVVTSQSKRLDILFNNAGVMALPEGTTKDGYEIQFGTNHVGPALLTKLLMPLLLKTSKEANSDVRIINLSSEAHNLGRDASVLLDVSKLPSQGTWPRYAYSKSANILFTQELAKRYPEITTVAIHPGLVKSDLWLPGQQASSIIQTIMNTALYLIGQPVPVGAKNQLWAATAEKGEVVSGTYYKPIGSASNGIGLARDPTLSEKLWNWTESEFEKHGFK